MSTLKNALAVVSTGDLPQGVSFLTVHGKNVKVVSRNASSSTEAPDLFIEGMHLIDSQAYTLCIPIENDGGDISVYPVSAACDFRRKDLQVEIYAALRIAGSRIKVPIGELLEKL